MKVKKLYSIALVSVLAASLSTGGMLYKMNNKKFVVDNSSLINISSHCDWPKYSNIDELVKSSDLIIVGRVSNDNKQFKNSPHPVFESSLSSEEINKVNDALQQDIITESEITIDKVIKGQPNESTIKIQQLGGTIGNITQKVEDIEFYKKGQKAIFFLKKANGFYVALNPTQGQIFIEDSKAKPNAKNKIFKNDEPEYNIVKEIENRT